MIVLSRLTKIVLLCNSMLRAGTLDLLAFPPRVARANYYPFRPAEVVGPHHDHSELFICATQGKATITVAGKIFDVTPGSLVHVPWGAAVHYQADRHKPLSMICLHLWYLPWDAPLIEAPPKTYNDEFPNSNPHPRTPALYEHPFMVSAKTNPRLFDVAAAIANASAEDRAGDRDRDLFLRGAALEFVTGVRHVVAGEGDEVSHPLAGLVREIASWMQLRIMFKLTRDDVVAHAGVSESTITNAFRAVTGKSPIAFLIDLRMAHARRLLRSTNAKVSAVAREVGIPDAAYFSKLFSDRHGMSPHQFRKRGGEVSVQM
jgi:AraC-like DNA-binding protein